jgi:hypothetical protein
MNALALHDIAFTREGGVTKSGSDTRTRMENLESFRELHIDEIDSQL